ncbi:hypothetical protein TOPH_08930 [Tolypocladium ophioglossoides CBS 100239]|uniref:Uncharacterized protein n=1 Tax=Tolypocladium ophioglossoides (strain CBS 100239) TaxID=1163406 RepID=A0A0L0MXD5_TOLOC|nr:hypothetical protein TOPH_08930 [Tolypocladium ophioglossoides CBS 100239]
MRQQHDDDCVADCVADRVAVQDGKWRKARGDRLYDYQNACYVSILVVLTSTRLRGLEVLDVGQFKASKSALQGIAECECEMGCARRRQPHADQTAEGAGQADEAIVKVGEAQGGGGHGEIGKVGEELEPADVDALALDDALAVLAVNLGLALLELVEGVQLGGDAEGEARGPEAVGLALGRLCALPLADAEGIGQGDGVEGEVAGVAELAAEGGVAQEGVGGLCVGGDGGGLEVLDGLAEAQDLAGEAEVLLEGVPGGHLGGGAVGAQQVPGVEAGEVLDGAEELVAADGGGDEAEVVGHRGVVDEGVCDHGGGCVDVDVRVCRCAGV